MGPEERIAFVSRGADKTRQGKADDLSDFAAWQAQAERIGWKHRSAIAYGPPAPALSRSERLEGAFQTGIPLFEDDLRRRAVVDAKDARLAMIRGLIRYGIEGTDDVKALTRAMVARGVRQDGKWTKVIWTEIAGGRVKLTTELHADQERELIDLARAAAADRARSLSPDEIAAAIERAGFTFEGEHGAAQRQTIERIGAGGAAGAFIGVAGVGKTSRVIPALVEAWKARGYTVWGTANAWIQANALREAGIDGLHCRAMQPFLEQLREGRVTLDGNSVVVLDELSQIGTRQLLELFRLRERHGFQLVLTGGERQCQAIEAGPVIELLREAWGAEAIPEILTTIRQKSAEERHLAGLFHDGKVHEALDIKRAQNTAELVEGGYRQCVQRIAALYVERRQANAHDPAYTVTISAPTNADALAIGREIRLARRAMGEIGPDRLTGVPATDGRGNTFSLSLAEGDKARLFRRTRALFVAEEGKRKSAFIGDNGSVREIVQILPDGLRLRGETGKVGFVAWDALRDRCTGRLLLTYGDCRTIDSAQGITSDEHINALPSGSKAVQGFKTYVAESRHRIASWFVGSMGVEMRDAMERRPLGLPELTAADQQRAAWANVVRNLSRQPLKESALGLLQGVTETRREVARSLQAGLRKQEARAAAGHPATTLRRTFKQRQARRAVETTTARMEASTQAQVAVTPQMAAPSAAGVQANAAFRASAALQGATA